MANPKKDDEDWHPDDDKLYDDDKGVLDILEEIFIDEDGEIRWVTIFVILLGIAALIDWRRDWVWLHGIQKVVAYINLDMADPTAIYSILV
jgi:hypothetical protein